MAQKVLIDMQDITWFNGLLVAFGGVMKYLVSSMMELIWSK